MDNPHDSEFAPPPADPQQSLGAPVTDASTAPEPLVIDESTPEPVPPSPSTPPASPAGPQPTPNADPGSDTTGTSLYRLTWLMLIIALLLLSRFLGPWLVRHISYAWNIGKQQAEYEYASQGLGASPLSSLSEASQMISKRVGPSVVHINVVGIAQDERTRDNPFGFRMNPSRGQGSGVIVDKRGYLLTNAHVIDGAKSIDVSLSDGRVVAAQTIGSDVETDLAVLKIDATDLIAAEWGDSDAVTEGGLVWALGSPFGLERSITFGILSAKHRVVGLQNPYQDFLQTDAAVNPGNSGGPLVDAQGRLIGINTAIIGESYQGISFALPSNIARQIYDRLRTTGHVTRGWLGVEPRDLSPAQARQLGLQDTRGAYIHAVANNPDDTPSPARRAGILAGDVILIWDGNPVESRIDLFSHVGMTAVGRNVEVTVFRDGRALQLQVAVEARMQKPRIENNQ
ncbi:MAG: serine protease [Blastopirellula sp.]|nr:serine protease [Blastopirellula sp.]